MYVRLLDNHMLPRRALKIAVKVWHELNLNIHASLTEAFDEEFTYVVYTCKSQACQI